jgi:hypothetical protein
MKDDLFQENAVPQKLLIGILFSQFLIILGLVSDLGSVITSAWFKTLVSSGGLTILSCILNGVLIYFVIRNHVRNKKKKEYFNALLKNEQQALVILKTNDTSLWKRFVRTHRSIMLDHLPIPSIRDAIEPLLDELSKRLPNNGMNYKVAVAKPEEDGKFKILAERGMDPSSVYIMEQKANWKSRESFFASALFLDEEKKYTKIPSGNHNYVNIQRPAGTGGSVAHFLVAIKSANYYNQFPENTISVVSIGIPSGQDFSDEEASHFYSEVYPILKGLESVLLGYLPGSKKIKRNVK